MTKWHMRPMPGGGFSISRQKERFLEVAHVYLEADAYLVVTAPQLQEALQNLVQRAEDWAARDFATYASDELEEAHAVLNNATRGKP